MNNTAILVKLKNVRKHPNADRLNLASVLGTTVVVGLDNFTDELGIYFDSNLQLSEEYCKNNNLFRKSELNVDPNKTGFIDENRRVRIIKLKGEYSNGLFMPLSSINFIDGFSDLDLKNKGEGFEFTELNGVLICKKYIIPARTPGMPGSKKQRSRKPIVSRLIDGQFKFHFDTDQLPRNLHRIHPDKIASISVKFHGTSSITSNCLVLRKLTFIEKLLIKLGFKIEQTEYDYVFSSRKVIKNGEMEGKEQNHYYGYDLWKEAGETFKGLLRKSETVYYEIVGFTKEGGYIQKDFDYGCKPNQYEIYVYRITETNVDGVVTELAWNEMKQRCLEMGVKHVVEKYHGYLRDHDGKAKEYYYSVPKEELNVETWRNLFLQDLKLQYLEKDSEYCSNKVPEEGIVLRIDGLNINSFKYKADAFWAHEDKLKEKGEADIEDNN